MAKKSPRKRSPRPTPAKDQQPPITVKKPLPPDALKRMVKFYQNSREIERQWRSIVGN